MSRSRLPIRPAPPTRPRYPRAGVVWGAFAAGALGVAPAIARADCALPEHGGAVDPGGKGTVKKGGKKPTTPVKIDPRPLPGKVAMPVPPKPPTQLGGEPMQVTPPGMMVAPRPPVPPPPPPNGGPVGVSPPLPPSHPTGGKPVSPEPPKPPSTPSKPDPQLDGDVAHVGSVRYIHPHGPDEPCLPPGSGRLVIRFA